MIGRQGDLFEQRDVDAICITTNGAVRRDGAAVMGRGCAAEAVRRWPGIQYALGVLINRSGNVSQVLTQTPMEKPLLGTSTGIYDVPWDIVAFPVKHHWRDQADFVLIQKSAHELVALANRHGWKRVALVRPGCGNGGRNWDDVRPLLESILDDRFVVVQQ